MRTIRSIHIPVTYAGRANDFDFGISFDDDALVDGNNVVFGVIVRRTSLVDSHDASEYEAEVAIEERDNVPMLVVRFQREELVALPFNDLAGDSTVEQVMERIPPIDPIVGCLVRGGLSAVVGQIIDCNAESGDFDWFSNRARAIYRCCRTNTTKIGMLATFRACKCMASQGLPF